MTSLGGEGPAADVPAAGARSHARGLGRLPAWSDAILGPVALAGLWQLAGTVLPWARYTLSSPSAIALRAWHDLAIYPTNVATTLSEAGRGFLWGNVVAIVLALVIVQAPRIEALLMQVAIVIYATPLLAIAPIIAVVLPGDEPKVVLAALAVFFPTVIAALIGLRSADAASLDLIHTLGGRSWDVLRKVRVPASVPWIFAGLRIAAPAAVLGAVLGEFLGGDRGLGVAMVNAMATLDTPRVWGLAIASSALAGAGFVMAAVAARALVTWSPPLDVAVASIGRLAGSAVGLPWAARRAGLLVLSIGVMLGLWTAFITIFHLNPFFAKDPGAVARDLFAGPQAPGERGALAQALAMTLADAAVGFAAGTAAAALVAVVFVVHPRLERAFMPVAIALRSVPVIAMTPLLVLLFGRGLLGTTVITGIITFFPTLVNVLQGLRSASPQAVEVLTLYGAAPWTVVWKVRLPSALPSLFASVRISALGSILGAIVAEWLATGRGLGYLMIISRAQFQFPMLWAAGMLVTVVSVVIYGIISWIEIPVLRRYAPGQVDQ
ncbi:MAG TPA: ABC transporter permease subunit [bacterium]|nr:ABC transporter permease subunit [bacterium]